MYQTRNEMSETVVVSTNTSYVVAETHLSFTQNLDINNNSNNLRYPTFFKIVKHKFNEIEFIDNYGIPTELFLDCCADLFSLLDNFGSTAFLPVKLDVFGNINKLRNKYSLDKARYRTLQGMIKHEIDEKVTRAKNSATDALMWLRRAIWFLREFFNEFSKKKNPEMHECVYIGYQNSLRQHHNFVVRGIFKLAVKALPTKDDFIKSLAVNKDDFLENKTKFEKQILEDMKVYAVGIDKCLDLLEKFYKSHSLEI